MRTSGRAETVAPGELQLEAGQRVPGKSGSLFRIEATPSERFELMEAEKANGSIGRMARLLEVSTSGFYAWLGRKLVGPSKRSAASRDLDTQVRRVHTNSDDVYGAPRVTAQLAREGVHVNEKTVAASMRRQGLKGSVRAGSSRSRLPRSVDLSHS